MAYSQTSASRTEKQTCGSLATEETDVMVELKRKWLPRLIGPVFLAEEDWYSRLLVHCLSLYVEMPQDTM